LWQLGSGIESILVDQDSRSTPRGPDRHRLAQRTRWHDTPITEAESAIHNQQRQVFNECRVLQPVVQNQDIRAIRYGGARRCGTIGTNPRGPYRCQQQCLVAD
jgi:hypothetical protein